MTSLKSYSAVIAKRMEFSAFQWISLNRKKLLQTRSYKYMFKIISKVFFYYHRTLVAPNTAELFFPTLYQNKKLVQKISSIPHLVLAF